MSFPKTIYAKEFGEEIGLVAERSFENLSDRTEHDKPIPVAEYRLVRTFKIKTTVVEVK